MFDNICCTTDGYCQSHSDLAHAAVCGAVISGEGAVGWFLLMPFACELQSKKKPARGGLDLVRDVIFPGYLRLADALRRRPATNNKTSIVRTIP